MWTNENRGRYDRSRLRYPSDLTDDEWNLVQCLIPLGKRGGDKRTVIMREVVNGLMYILSTGCQWRAIPKDLPPRSTLYDYFDLWSWDGTLDRIHHALYMKCREAASRDASPTAAVIDSQSVKSAEKGGLRLIRPQGSRLLRPRRPGHSRRHRAEPPARQPDQAACLRGGHQRRGRHPLPRRGHASIGQPPHHGRLRERQRRQDPRMAHRGTHGCRSDRPVRHRGDLASDRTASCPHSRKGADPACGDGGFITIARTLLGRYPRGRCFSAS